MANASNSSSVVNYDDYTTYTEYKAGLIIWKLVPPILILLGTVGNCLTIVVLTRRSIRTSTTSLFLTVLAFSDLLVLYSGLLRQWIIYLFDTDVRKLSEVGCKLNIWLVYSSLDFSAWILIAVTLERVISAWLPHKARTVCTKLSATAFLISIGVLILCLNSHLMYGMVFKYSYDENGNSELTKCTEINESYYTFFNITWPWIDLCAFCVIPFVVIVIGNALILFKVIQSQKKANSRIVPSVQARSRQHASSSYGKHSSMTAMLFTLNIVFLFSTSPVSIYNIGYTYWADNVSEHRYAQLDLWWAIVNMLMYTNNSLNFLLYCLSGTKFRAEVFRLFRPKGRGSNSSNMQMAVSNYTRTKFDTPSPCPSPRHSVFTTTASENISHSQIIQSDDRNGPGHISTTIHSGNTLHPNDAKNAVNNLHVPDSKDVQLVNKLSDKFEDELKILNNIPENERNDLKSVHDLSDKLDNLKVVNSPLDKHRDDLVVVNGPPDKHADDLDIVNNLPVATDLIDEDSDGLKVENDTQDNHREESTAVNELPLVNDPPNNHCGDLAVVNDRPGNYLDDDVNNPSDTHDDNRKIVNELDKHDDDLRL